jgi:hypothetical protein
MTKATVPIDTQERKRLENLEKAKRKKEEHEIITDKIERGVASALHKFGLLFTAQTVEKVEKLAEKIDKRQEELAQAEERALAARASTFRANNGK